MKACVYVKDYKNIYLKKKNKNTKTYVLYNVNYSKTKRH